MPNTIGDLHEMYQQQRAGAWFPAKSGISSSSSQVRNIDREPVQLFGQDRIILLCMKCHMRAMRSWQARRGHQGFGSGQHSGTAKARGFEPCRTCTPQT